MMSGVMIVNAKALVVVMTVALAVFVIGKPLALKFMAERDFIRRRNIWCVLTVTAFLSPSFWLFAAVAVPLLIWATRQESNPMALYVLLLHVIPPMSIQIPVFGIGQLFDLNNYRILSLSVLLVATWLVARRPGGVPGSVRAMDLLVLSFAALHLLLLMPYESVTHTMRRGFLYFLDALLVYYVASRVCTDRRSITETMAAFCLAAAILAPLAIFEMGKRWLLYAEIGPGWGSPHSLTAYLFRGSLLRAQVSAGHSIPLGYLLAMALGFWLYLQSRQIVSAWKLFIPLLFTAGLIAAHARAPWLVALLVLFAYLALAPKGFARFSLAAVVAAGLGTLLVLSPWGDRVIDVLPFIGTVDADNITYRQVLFEESWEQIKKNPIFGNPLVLLNLEHLRQGQGIIDLLNAYTTIAMFYGVPALALLLGFFLIGMIRTYQVARLIQRTDGDFPLLGGSLVACMLGTLLMMATGSFGTSLEKFFYLLAGLAAGFVSLHEARQHAVISARRGPARYIPG